MKLTRKQSTFGSYGGGGEKKKEKQKSLMYGVLKFYNQNNSFYNKTIWKQDPNAQVLASKVQTPDPVKCKPNIQEHIFSFFFLIWLLTILY